MTDSRTPRTRAVQAANASRAALSLLVLCVAIAGVGCPCLGAVTDVSPELRWYLFSNYGAERMCPEMLKQGVGLRMSDRAPAIGRFFPSQCSYNVNEADRTVTVHFAGTGYAFVQPAKRVGFSATTSIELRPDFQIAGDDVYVWGRLNRIVQGPDFQVGTVENPVVGVATTFTPVGALANFFGNQIVAGELTRGFTVVHNEDAGNSFTLGLIMPPAKPFHPFDVSDSEFYTFANETVELHANQRDYLGPFEVTDTDQTLRIRANNAGPPVDLMVVSKAVGDQWREAYQTGQALGPPPGPVLGGGPLRSGDNVQNLRLPPGMYYAVLDHTQYAGTENPPVMPLNPLSDPIAQVSYVAQLVE